MTWKHLSLSVTGKSHSDRNERGQDYYRTGVVRLGTGIFLWDLLQTGRAARRMGVWGRRLHAKKCTS